MKQPDEHRSLQWPWQSCTFTFIDRLERRREGERLELGILSRIVIPTWLPTLNLSRLYSLPLRPMHATITLPPRNIIADVAFLRFNGSDRFITHHCSSTRIHGSSIHRSASLIFVHSSRCLLRSFLSRLKSLDLSSFLLRDLACMHLPSLFLDITRLQSSSFDPILIVWACILSRLWSPEVNKQTN